MKRVPESPAAPLNQQHLVFWGCFIALITTSFAFFTRMYLCDVRFGADFGIDKVGIGALKGAGVWPFAISIILFSLVIDRIGYKVAMFFSFLCYVIYLVMAWMAYGTIQGVAPDQLSAAQARGYQLLYWGSIVLGLGNGTVEAFINPVVATMFNREKTKWLNILHAGWPGGLILGGLASYFMAGNAATKPVSWQIQISLFLVPVVFYGLMMLGQRFPKSEASSSGVSFRDMLGELGLAGAAVICCLLALFFKSDLGLSPLVSAGIAAALLAAFGAATGFRFGHLLLAFLLLVHAMVGYVELGTDSWISKITGAIMASPANGLLLFVYTSSLMFILRFFAGPIVEKISPLGLLAASAIFGAIGLTLLGNAEGAVMCVVAATVYGIGKTFLWPTMLAVVSEQFPKGGAITIGAAGGVGMLAAGLLGGPGIGFLQDKNASENLRSADAAVFERYRAPKENEFLWLKAVGLDGAKVGVLEDGGKEAERALALLEKEQAKPETVAAQRELVAWWTDTAAPTRAADQPLVEAAGLFGGRQALKLTALVPATMFVCYALLLAWFKARGGYQARGLGH